jgi:hypothetical protein
MSRRGQVVCPAPLIAVLAARGTRTKTDYADPPKRPSHIKTEKLRCRGPRIKSLIREAKRDGGRASVKPQARTQITRQRRTTLGLFSPSEKTRQLCKHDQVTMPYFVCVCL